LLRLALEFHKRNKSDLVGRLFTDNLVEAYFTGNPVFGGANSYYHAVIIMLSTTPEAPDQQQRFRCYCGWHRAP